MLSQLLLLLPFLALSTAQGYGQKSSKATTKTTQAAAATTAAAASSAIHTVQVGNGGLVFTPNNLKAAAGDQVEFHFASAGHSVAEGSFSSACQPSGENAFYSGLINSASGPPFTITINNTDPLWFYCSAPGHCQAGMVGVINARSGEPEAKYAAAAKKSSSSKSPSKVGGGVFAAAKPASGSSTTTTGGSTAVSAASSSSSAASASPSPGGAANLNVMGVLGLVGLSAPVAFVAMAGF